jgi:hypothetical protein
VEWQTLYYLSRGLGVPMEELITGQPFTIGKLAQDYLSDPLVPREARFELIKKMVTHTMISKYLRGIESVEEDIANLISEDMAKAVSASIYDDPNQLELYSKRFPLFYAKYGGDIDALLKDFLTSIEEGSAKGEDVSYKLKMYEKIKESIKNISK